MARNKKPELDPKFARQLLAFAAGYRGAYPANNTEFEGSCGTNIVYGLNGDNVAQQLRSLINAFEIGDLEPEFEYDGDENEVIVEVTDNYNHRTQVVLSDTVDRYHTTWNATKSVSYHGPISNNPNSGNDIQVYILTLKCLPALVALLPINIQNRFFKDEEPKPIKKAKKKKSIYSF